MADYYIYNHSYKRIFALLEQITSPGVTSIDLTSLFRFMAVVKAYYSVVRPFNFRATSWPVCLGNSHADRAMRFLYAENIC